MSTKQRLRRFDVALSPSIRLRVAEQGDRDGPALVLLPAYADSWFSYSRVLASLPRRIRALAVDLRGHGRSSKPACCYGVDDLAGDVIRLLELRSIDAATLVGHSGSCLVARHVALARPELVERLVLLGSPLVLDAERLQPFREALRTLPDPVPTDFIRAFQLGAVHRSLPDPFVARLVEESGRVPARVWRDALDGLIAYDDRASLPALGAPTRLLWGDRDSIVSRADQAALVAAIPDASVHVLEDTGHSPQWERPEDVASELDRLLPSLPAGGATLP